MDLELFTITLHDEKVIGAQSLLGPPAYDRVNRIITLRDIHAIRDNMAHWQGGNLILAFLCGVGESDASFADRTKTRIRCRKWDRLNCFRSVIFFYAESTHT